MGFVEILCVISFTVILNSGLTYSAGTNVNLKSMVIGRCEQYQQIDVNGKLQATDNTDTKMPAVNCVDIWNAFNDSIAFRDPCTIEQNSYDELFRLMDNQKFIKDSVMFWSGTEAYTKKLTALNPSFLALANIFPGFLFTDLHWCPDPKGSGPVTSGFETGEVYGYDMVKDCPLKCSPVGVFWIKASIHLAKISSGTVYYMVNAEFEVPYRPDSFFATVELPTLKKNKSVKKLVVYVLQLQDKKIVSTCDSTNVKQIKADAAPEIKDVECIDNPPEFQFLLCGMNPKHKNCKPMVNGKSRRDQTPQQWMQNLHPVR